MNEDLIKDHIAKLLDHAYRDTGGSKRCAMFLLSLWDGNRYKADLQDLMYIDEDIFLMYMNIYRYLYEHNLQLDSLVSDDKMKPIIKCWGDVFRHPNDESS